MQVSFLTDVEGNWEYFVSFVQCSEALSFADGPRVDAEGTCDLVLADGWRFVFGGDVCDKGGAVGGTVRVVRSLLALKRKHPTRVALLLGNRDINKMRLTSEMAPSQLRQLETVPGPYWVPPAKRVSLAKFLRRQVSAHKGIDEVDVDDAMLRERNTPASRLRYMLKETMGAEGEFERRQAELGDLRGVGPEQVSEDEVVRSFLESVAPGGFMCEFLEQGQLALLIGSTLFVHGGLIGGPWAPEPEYACSHCFGYVPGRSGRLLDMARWLEALDEWKRAELAAWRAEPLWSAAYAESDARGEPPAWPDAASARGGHRLMHYVVPGCEPSVVMGRHLDSLGMPACAIKGIDEVAAMLNGCGVTRLVVGHTPHGNCPTVTKIGGPREVQPCLEVIMADTSYSDMSAADNRGDAVAEVILRGDGGARVHGVLQDGSVIRYTLEPGVGPTRELVGQLEPEHHVGDGEARRFVKARLPRADADTEAQAEAHLDWGGPSGRFEADYLLCHVRGFVTTYEVVSEGKLSDTRRRGSSFRAGEGEVSEEDTLPITHIHSHGDEACVGAPPEFYHMDLVAFLYSSFLEADTDGDASLSVDELRVALRDNPGFLKLVAGSDSQPPSADELIVAMAGAGASSISLDMFAAYCQGRQDHASHATPREEARARTRQQVAKWFVQQEQEQGALEDASVDAQAAALLERLQLVWMTTEQRAALRMQRMFRSRQARRLGKSPRVELRWPPKATEAAVAHCALSKSVERLQYQADALAQTIEALDGALDGEEADR